MQGSYIWIFSVNEVLTVLNIDDMVCGSKKEQVMGFCIFSVPSQVQSRQPSRTGISGCPVVNFGENFHYVKFTWEHASTIKCNQCSTYALWFEFSCNLSVTVTKSCQAHLLLAIVLADSEAHDFDSENVFWETFVLRLINFHAVQRTDSSYNDRENFFKISDKMLSFIAKLQATWEDL